MTEADNQHFCSVLRELISRIEQGEEVHCVVSEASPSKRINSHTYGNQQYTEYLLFHLIKHHLFNEFRNNVRFDYPKVN